MSNNVNNNFSKSRRLTANILLFINLFFPLTNVYAAVAQVSAESAVLPSRSNTLADYDDLAANLPNLGSETSQNTHSAQTIATGAAQAGQLLSHRHAMTNSLDYTRSLGESYINQQVSDWLSQYGNARVELSTRKTGSANLLIPLQEHEQSLFFGQTGLRRNEDRDTAHVGLGYRHYQTKWMWGVNSFYDYDLTGNNARLGLGSELWFDHLKFAANGYFRLTDWRQSTLHAMRDYDERPANGLDLRVEGYWPSYPQLGAYAKYEHYFGDDINIKDHATIDELKHNPYRTTLGLSYTPIPLITLKGQSSAGDDTESRIELALSYRFGLPLSAQLDPNNVNVMRSLAGNRYDFVDRHYDIVMQYRKQELLAISLPESVSVKAAQTIPVTAIINKAKYGLNRIEWSAPELIAQGGKITVTGTNTIQLQIPTESSQIKRNQRPSYQLSAVAFDNAGNRSNNASMLINVEPSEEVIDSLVISPENTILPANNNEAYTATITLKDSSNIPIANKAVTFALNGFTDNSKLTLSDEQGNTGNPISTLSDANGQTQITIKSLEAGRGQLRVSLDNGTHREIDIRFDADLSTATIDSLRLTQNDAVANGNATNIAIATVLDRYGNPVENVALTASASNGATVLTPNLTTDAQGQITIPFTSHSAGETTLTVSGVGTQKEVLATFIADISRAVIADLTVSQDNAFANGVANNSLIVTIQNEQGNPISHAPVTIDLPNTATTYTTIPANGLTDARGQLTIHYASTLAGSADYRVSINQSKQSATLTFLPDATTATIKQITLIPNDAGEPPYEKIADGINSFSFLVEVVDHFGNPIPNVSVTPSVDQPNVTVAVAGATNAQGKTELTLTSSLIAVANIQVKASVNNGDPVSATQLVSFIGDKALAQVSALTLLDTTTSKVANDTNTFTYRVLVNDTHGNTIPGATVEAHSNSDNTSAILSGTTDQQGYAMITLRSNGIATNDITVYANVSGSTVRVDADKTVNFTADSSTAKVTQVTLDGTTTSKIANHTSTFTYTVTVQDDNGNAVKDQAIELITNNTNVTATSPNLTDEQGQTTITLQSNGKVAQDIIVSANVAGTTAQVDADKVVNFTADPGSAKVIQVILDDSSTSKVANQTNTFTYTVTVQDANGNAVEGATIEPSTNSNNTSTTLSGPTDNAGRATITLNSNGIATSNIMVAAKVANTDTVINADKTVNFIADSAIARVTHLTLEGDITNKAANHTNTFTYTVTVQDPNGNAVAGATVHATTDNNNTSTALSGPTNAAGQATITLSSNGTAAYDIMLSANVEGSSIILNADKRVNFTADSATAAVTQVTLEGTVTSQAANATNTFTYTVTVQDANGNAVEGSTVTAHSSSTATATTISGPTNAAGQTTITLSSNGTAANNITVSANVTGSNTTVNADKTVDFTADSATANVTQLTLEGTVTSKAANATNTFIYTVTVQDANGNAVQNATIDVASNSTNTSTSLSGLTDNTGHATITLSSNGIAAKEIMISAKVNGNNSVINADKTVNFTADITTAKVTRIVLQDSETSKIANSTNTFTYLVYVRDSNGNAVSGANIDTTSSSSNTSTSLSGPTNTDGRTTITLNSNGHVANNITVSANAEGSSIKVDADKKVNFIADNATAKVATVTLNGSVVSKAANGTNTFTYTVTVQDSNGNALKDKTIEATTNSANTSVAISGNTDKMGRTTITLSSNGIATSNIIVSANVSGSAIKIDADKSVNFIADKTTAKITALNLNGSVTSKAANNNNTFTYTVTVQDDNGNPVNGATLQISSSSTNASATINGSTDENGHAIITLSNNGTATNNINVSANLAGSTTKVDADKRVNFTADSATAKVTHVTLSDSVTTKVANNTNTFTYIVTVQDSNGNAVNAATIEASTNNGNTQTAISSPTNDQGQTTITLNSNGIATSDIIVSANVTGSNIKVDADKMVTFTADIATARVTHLALEGAVTSKIANDTNTFTYTVTVQDNNGNAINNATIEVLTSSTNTIATANGATDTNGLTSITLSSNGSADSAIMVSAKVSGTNIIVNADRTVNFTADSASARVTQVTLDDTVTSKVATNSSAFTYTVTVQDTHGNPVAGRSVEVSSNSTNTAATVSSTTDTNGHAKVILNSNGVAVNNVMISANVTGSNITVNADKTVAFIADLATANVASVTLVDTTTSKVANDTNTFTYTVNVQDSNGNVVKGATIAVTPSSSNTTASISGTTDDNGLTTVTLHSNGIAVNSINLSVSVQGTNAKVDANKLVNFIADQASAEVAYVTLNGTVVSRPANSANTFTYTVTVQDRNGNAVAGKTVEVSTSSANTSATISGTTDGNGLTTLILSNNGLTASDIMVSAKVAGSSISKNANKTVDFTSDRATAKVVHITLNDATTSKVASSANTFTYTVTVQDSNGNSVEDATIEVSSSDPNTSATINDTTDQNGQATLTLSSNGVVANNVLVSANVTGSSIKANADKTVNFIADTANAKVTHVTLNDTITSKAANSTNTFTYTVTVQDSNGNLIKNATVNASTSSSDTSITVNGVTNDSGQTTLTLGSNGTAVEDITVTANVAGSTIMVNADKTVDFTADKATAKVVRITLEGNMTNKVANPNSTFTYNVLVQDSHNNVVKDATLEVASSSSNATATIDGPTDAEGLATLTLRSNGTATNAIMVSANVTGSNITVNANQTVSFTADSSTKKVTSVMLNNDSVTSKAANNTNTFTYTVTVQDNNGNAISGETVHAASSSDKTSVEISGATDSNGQATITLKSNGIADDNINVSANIVGSDATTDANKKVNFIADRNTARITTVTLDDAITSKAANATNTFTYTVTVEDINGNPIQDAAIEVASSSANTSATISGNSDDEGTATLTLSSNGIATNAITVSANLAGSTTKVNADKTVNFIADKATAKVVDLTLNDTVTSKVANTSNTFTYRVAVQDSHGNVVKGATIEVSADNPNTSATISGTTDANGFATLTLNNNGVTSKNVTVTANVTNSPIKVNSDKTVNFIADKASARVMSVTLNDNVTSKVAKTTSAFTYTVLVQDINGNVVPDVAIDISSGSPNISTHLSGPTNDNGIATITLSSNGTATKNIGITASISGSNISMDANKNVNFIADSATANVTHVTLNGTATNKVANSDNTFTYTVLVQDANGNVVNGMTVEAASSSTNTSATISGVTDINGQTTLTLSSNGIAASEIIASAKVKNASATVNADKRVNFIANRATAKVAHVTLEGAITSKAANSSNSFTYTVTVEDSNGNPVKDATVEVSSSSENTSATINDTTNANGQATLTLNSNGIATANITVSAKVTDSPITVNGDKSVTFTADKATARVTHITLNDNVINKAANATNTFTYTVTVQDSNGNLVEGSTIDAATSSSNTNISISGPTNANGQATLTLSSNGIVASLITVSANVTDSTIHINADKKVNFIADSATAKVTQVTLKGSVTSKVASSTNTFSYTVTVQDSNGNVVKDISVNASSSSSNTTATLSGPTDVNGRTTITLSSNSLADHDITVSANVEGSEISVNADKTVNFTANSATASVTHITLNGTETSKAANNTNVFTYTVLVQDSHGNVVPAANIDVFSSSANTSVAINGQTDANGQATITLSSNGLAENAITVSAKVSGSNITVNADKNVNFIADSATAKVTHVTLQGSVTSKVANTTNTFNYLVTVQDSHGNVVAGATVEATSNYANLSTTLSGTTDANGQATLTLSSNGHAAHDITVSAQVAGSNLKTDSDKTVTFTADSSSARVTHVTLQGEATSKAANNKNSFTYLVTVEDSNGNAIKAAQVTASSSSTNTSVAVSGTTDEHGQATLTLTSNGIAASNITVSASLTGSNIKVDADNLVNFTADRSTAKVTTLTLNGKVTSKAANNSNTFTYTVTAKDANGNVVKGAAIKPTSSSTNAPVSINSITDDNGQATITLSSNGVATNDITVSANVAGSRVTVKSTKKVSFIADIATAKITAGEITFYPSVPGTYSWLAVRDANGNFVPNVELLLEVYSTNCPDPYDYNGKTVEADPAAQFNYELYTGLNVNCEKVQMKAKITSTATPNNKWFILKGSYN